MRKHRVKSKLITVLILFVIATAGGAAEMSASLLYKIDLGEKSTPTDVVINSDGSAGVYDAFYGTYTTYRRGHAAGTVQKAFLKGGNCMVRSGNYYLFCNSRGRTLDMLTGSFERYASFSASGGSKGFDPTDALVSGGKIFAVDNDNHRVVRFDTASRRVSGSVGGYGEERMRFWYPYGIAMDSKGVLYISEVLNTRIQKITKDFKFYEILGGWGINPGEFYRPTGIAVLKNGLTLVGDGYTGVIQFFGGNGKYEGIVKNSSGTKLKLGSITHIRVNGNKLAVVDAFDKTVNVYELKGRK